MKHALLFVTILPLSIYSQTLKGVVLDSVTNEKLLYANLVIKNKSIGIYSNEDGTYKFDLSKASTEDTLVVSLIGFHNQKIGLSQFIDSKSHILNFKLLPKIESLDEVLIVSKSTENIKKQVKISTGNRRLVFPASVPFGYETAVFIENPKHKKGQLLKLHLKFKDSSREIYETHQTYYRLAFYSVDDLGFPGELLYFENIIIKPAKDIKNYKIDLEDKAIPFTKTGLFVGIETIKPDHIALIGSMYLTTPSILHTHTTKNLEYRRFRSNDWSKQSRKSVFKKKLYTAPFIKIEVVYEK